MRRTFGYRELLTKEVIEVWRTYRLGVLCALFVVLGIAVPVMERYLPGFLRRIGVSREEIRFQVAGVPGIVEALAADLALAGTVAAILLAMGAVAGERRRGTLMLILSRPVSRAAVLWAKYVALGMVIGLATGLGVLAAWLYTSLFFGPQEALPWLELGAVLWLSAMVTTAVTLLGSVVAPTPMGAGAVGAAFAGMMWVAAGATPVARLLPAGLPDVARAVALEDVSPDLAPAVTVTVSFLVIAASLCLAWWRFRRLEP